MRKIFCDLCETEVSQNDDVITLSMVRADRDKDLKEVPYMPDKEICILCATKIKEFVSDFDTIDKMFKKGK